MGSPDNEPGRLSNETLDEKKRIEHAFAISAHLTTVSQFSRFDGGAHAKRLPRDFSTTDDKPVVWATWFEAAAYCNWLSTQEGLTPCYEVLADGTLAEKPNALDLNGYRLPTDAEVEYANRATTRTCRHYGETEDLLGEYAWYQKNSGEVTHPVGTRKPNDFGLFDMQGNAFTWCHDRAAAPAGAGGPPGADKRVLRGAAFYFMAISLRAARRHDDVPTMRGFYYSFRVAKTLK